MGFAAVVAAAAPVTGAVVAKVCTETVPQVLRGDRALQDQGEVGEKTVAPRSRGTARTGWARRGARPGEFARPSMLAGSSQSWRKAERFMFLRLRSASFFFFFFF